MALDLLDLPQASGGQAGRGARKGASTNSESATGSTSSSPFQSFASILRASQHLDPSQRLDPTIGTAFRFAQASFDKAEHARVAVASASGASALGRISRFAGAGDDASGNGDEEDWELDTDPQAWEMEARTWLLVGMLTK